MIPKSAGHRLSLRLAIDINNRPSFTVKAINDEKIQDFPKTLKSMGKKGLHMIGFFDNSSVLCLWKEKKKRYAFSDKWNGMFFIFEDL